MSFAILAVFVKRPQSQSVGHANQRGDFEDPREQAGLLRAVVFS